MHENYSPGRPPVYGARMYDAMNVPMPGRMLHEVRGAARRLGVSRTQVVRDAVQQYLSALNGRADIAP